MGCGAEIGDIHLGGVGSKGESVGTGKIGGPDQSRCMKKGARKANQMENKVLWLREKGVPEVWSGREKGYAI